jgi:hypothetical protein
VPDAVVEASPRYAVAFREACGVPAVGALVVDRERLRLEGRRPGEQRFELSAWFAELTEVRVGRAAGERLHGRATVVLARHCRSDLQIEPFGAGFLHEIVDLLAMLAATDVEDRDSVSMRVRLRSGCRERARELIAAGPPFDPATLGLQRHRVFLGPEEAIFVLDGPRVHAKLAQALRDPGFWRAAVGWRTLIVGRPFITAPAAARPGDWTLVYSWSAGDR